MIDRFFLPQIFQKEIVLLEKEEQKHAKVLKIQKGDIITLVNGKNQLAKAKVVEINKQALHAAIISIEERSFSKYTNTLALALIKQSRLETLVEKAVEIGIDRLLFFVADKSEKTGLNHERLNRIAISALKQSGRWTLPTIEKIASMDEVFSEDQTVFYGEIKCKKSIQKRNDKACFLIGPEKGWSKKEREILQKKAFPVELSQNVLRAETAGIIAAHLLCYPQVF